jgi:hypothetical protein
MIDNIYKKLTNRFQKPKNVQPQSKTERKQYNPKSIMEVNPNIPDNSKTEIQINKIPDFGEVIKQTFESNFYQIDTNSAEYKRLVETYNRFIGSLNNPKAVGIMKIQLVGTIRRSTITQFSEILTKGVVRNFDEKMIPIVKKSFSDKLESIERKFNK